MKQKLKKYLRDRYAELMRQEETPERAGALKEVNDLAACFEIKLK